MITLAQWNVNGWAYKREGNVSGKFRSDVIIETGYDVYAICETHLVGNNGISVPGYTWYGHNRTELNANAIRGSGGVGFLIANHILNDYSVNIIDQSYEGIYWIRLDSQASGASLMLCACYLPPVGSSRGNTAQEFYDTLLTQTYMYYDGSQLYYLGDFNGRIGNKDDFNPAVDQYIKTTCGR